MDILIQDLQHTPHLYLNLPSITKTNRQYGPALAAAAVEYCDSFTQMLEIYMEIPLSFRQERGKSGLTYKALQVAPAIYPLLPENIRSGNWLLLDVCVNILWKKNNRCSNPTLWLQPSFRQSIPPVMFQCILHFWADADRKKEEYPCGADERIEQARRASVKATNWMRQITKEMVNEWMLNEPEIAYTMLPWSLRLQLPSSVIDPLLENWKCYPHALLQIPDCVLERNLNKIRTMVEEDGFQFIRHLPPSFQKTHYTAFSNIILFQKTFLTKEDMEEVTESTWLQNPEWVTRLVENNPELYPFLPFSVRTQHPELVRHVYSTNYHLIPDEFKRGKWDMALEVVARQPVFWLHMPDSMKDVDWAVSLTERAHVIELACLFTLLPHTLNADPRQNNTHYRISSAELWENEYTSIPQSTQRALLEHLYYSKQHEHLRCMGLFGTTRDMLLRKHTWQQRTIQGPLHHQVSFPSYLGKYLSERVMNAGVPHIFSEAHDYTRWTQIETRVIWLCLNRLLYNIHHNKSYELIQKDAEWSMHKIAQNIRRFCMYPWSTLDDESENPEQNKCRSQHIHHHSLLDVEDSHSLWMSFEITRRQCCDYIQEILADEHFAPSEEADPERARITQGVTDKLHALLAVWYIARDFFDRKYPLQEFVEMEDEVLPLFQQAVAKGLPATTDSDFSTHMSQKAKAYLGGGGSSSSSHLETDTTFFLQSVPYFHDVNETL
jgi:hypothetical protein